MRNIKTTLRIARNSALLFVAASGAAYLTGCSNDIDSPTPGGNPVDEAVKIDQISVTAGTNPNLAKTYDNSHQGTRASFDVPEHPGMPALPTQAELDAMYIVTSETNFWNVGNLNPTSFYVKGDVSPNQLRTENQEGRLWEGYAPVTKYYVDGTLTIGSFGGSEDYPCEVYLMRGAKLICGGNIPTNTTIYLYEGGDLVQASSTEKTIYHKGSLIAEEDLDHNDTDIYIQGNIYTFGKINGKTVELNNAGDIYAGCSVTAEDYLYVTNAAKICAGYVSAPYIKLDSAPKILLRDGGYLYAPTKLEISNADQVRIEAEEGEYAMVETDELKMNMKSQWNAELGAQDAINAFRNVGVVYNSFSGTDAEGDILFHQSVNANNSKEGIQYTVVDSDDECAPKVVTGPTTPTPPGPELENIGSVAPTENHTHPISATCIYTNGQDAYLSWHTQGENFHGCIEYLTVANGEVNLNAYLETSRNNEEYGAIDFNHVIYDNGKIFVAGDHPKKGGIVGWIECNEGAFVTGEAKLNMAALYGEKYYTEGGDSIYVNSGSGNCIIRNGNYYQVASIKGFETFNVDAFDTANANNWYEYKTGDKKGEKYFMTPKSIARLGSWTFDSSLNVDPMIPRDGSRTGKHIATDGNKVVMLTLINRDNAANTATASIKVFNATDVNYTNCLASYEVADAVLSPVDGKDVIAIQGNDIWVCLGQGGVQHLTLSGNTISKKSEFVLTNMTKEELKGWEMSTKEAAASCANGLAVDEKYVYVAHGGAGLIVLNKTDLSFVTRTRYNGGNSANYVALNNDGYIYVAYGKSNVQVFGWKNGKK